MTAKASDIRRAGESGSALVYVMVGVVLFAALMYTFSQSSRPGSGVNDKQLELTSSEIIGYAQGLERATSRLVLRDVSENKLSFDNSQVAGYANPDDCGSDACKVFAVTGGGATWEDPPASASDTPTNWVITVADAVPGIGDDSMADLLLFLPGIRKDLCIRINDDLNIFNPGGNPPADTDGIDLTPYTGAFIIPPAGRISDSSQMNRKRAGCFHDDTTDKYLFFAVLIEH